MADCEIQGRPPELSCRAVYDYGELVDDCFTIAAFVNRSIQGAARQLSVDSAPPVDRLPVVFARTGHIVDLQRRGDFDEFLSNRHPRSDSLKKVAMRSLFVPRLLNCFSHTSLNRARTLRFTSSWSS